MKEIIRWSTKRARAYKRHFDHDKARQMLAQPGMTVRQVAEHFGVSKSAIFKMKLRTTTEKPTVFPQIFTCPRCFGRKGRDSKLCKQCDTETRIYPLKSTYHGPRREILAGVEEGRIINYQGSYGVVLAIQPGARKRRISFWDGPDELLDMREEVTVLEHTDWTA